MTSMTREQVFNPEAADMTREQVFNPEVAGASRNRFRT